MRYFNLDTNSGAPRCTIWRRSKIEKLKLTQTNWSKMPHAYGMSDDTKVHLVQLFTASSDLKLKAVKHLNSAVVPQSTIFLPAGFVIDVLTENILLLEKVFREETSKEVGEGVEIFFLEILLNLEILPLANDLNDMNNFQFLFYLDDSELMFESESAASSYMAYTAIKTFEATHTFYNQLVSKDLESKDHFAKIALAVKKELSGVKEYAALYEAHSDAPFSILK